MAPSVSSLVNEDRLAELNDIAKRLRYYSVTSTTAANSGHPTTCSSIAEILSVLFFHTMKYKVQQPKDASNDRFILSKGHAAPILYAAWAEAGLFPVSELNKLRSIDSDLEGHPTPRLNFIDVGTGSLGQGLSVAAGMAYVGKYIDKAPYRVFCLMGDGESAEGSVWEGLHFASHYNLDNLVAIFDVNRLGQSEATALAHDLETYKKRLEAFGFATLIVDGHDVEDLCRAFQESSEIKGRPVALICKTFKGRDFPGIEDENNFHGKPLPGDQAQVVLKHLKSQLTSMEPTHLIPSPPSIPVPAVNIADVKLSAAPNYKIGQSIATRVGYGNGLQKLAEANPRVIALDADMNNSTFSNKVLQNTPNQYLECFIAEQNMIGVATGLMCRDRAIAFTSTFAAFLSRAFDQFRMGAISQSNLNICGSHAGITTGEDGPSQMALEDISMFRSIPGSTVFYPSDAVSAERSVELAANTKGICFIRTNRPATPVIYENHHKFQVGKAHIIRQSEKDKLLLIGAGVTLFEALSAADELAKIGIHARVIDPFTIKPLDPVIIEHAKAVGGRVLTVEDHYLEGGIGEAVSSLLGETPGVVVKKLAIMELPRSGLPALLLERFGISANCIVKAAKELVANQ